MSLPARAGLGWISWRLMIAGALAFGVLVAARPASLPVAAAASPDWPSFQHDAQGTGADPVQPRGSVWARGWTSPLDGAVVAQPLLVGGEVVVATAHNSVYALDPATGALVWHINLGQSLPPPNGCLGTTSGPEVGIMSTPVADTSTGVLYVVATLNNAPRHELFALSLTDGSTLWHRVVDVPGAEPLNHDAQGALVLSQGNVYIPFGGYAGECGPFTGRLVEAAADGTGSLNTFTVPANGFGGSIGGNSGEEVGAVTVDPADGSLLVATGNGATGATPALAESVLRLSPSLSLLDSFTPTNWVALDLNDFQMSSAPVLVGGNRIFEMSQSGTGYLLNASALGGLGGEVYSAAVCGGGNGSVAVSGLVIYVPCTDGLVALTVAADGMSFRTTWSKTESLDNTPVLSGGMVWTEANGGFLIPHDAATGEQGLFSPVGAAFRHELLSSGGGRIFVAAEFNVVEFNSLAVLTTSLPAATAGQPYSTSLISLGGVAPVRWLPAAGSSLPAGLALTAAGVLSGTPRLAGPFTFTVNATDASSPFPLVATGTLSLTVNPGLAITTLRLPVAQVGVAYSQTLAAAGGVTPLTWSLRTGSSLPNGLALDSSGNLTGTPTTSGTTLVGFQVTDSSSPPVTSDADLSIGVLPSASAGASWSSFQHDAQASGADVVQTAVGASQAWTVTLDGKVVAQPLVAGGVVLAATEHDTVWALDPATGAVIWQNHLGDSIPSAALPCGGGSVPEVGIRGTPVVDTATGTLYVVATLANAPRHELFALKLSDGSILWHENVDVPGTDPLFYNQEGGLVLSHSKVYIPYGTYAGCLPFLGRLLAVAEDGSGAPSIFTVPANGAGGGIGGNGGQQAGAVSVDPIDGSLLVATGPGVGMGTADSASSVLRLSPDLAPVSSFTPLNWLALNVADSEMSSAPVIVGGNRVFELNQNGTGYLLDAGTLGELYTANICAGLFATGSVAVHGLFIYVPCSDGLVAVTLSADGMSFSIAWSQPGGAASSPIYAGGLVWTHYAGGVVDAYDAGTGSLVFSASDQSSFPNGGLASGGGRIFVPTVNSLVAYNLIPARATSTLATAATATAPVGQPITDAATLTVGVSLHPATGTITFTLFGPTDSGCTGPPVFTSQVTVSGPASYASASFTPTGLGAYRWIVSYSGDANVIGSGGACGDPGETSTVTPATPALTTTSSTGIVVGSGTIADSAVLSGSFAATGTIVFSAYGPNDGACAATPAFTSTVGVNGDGTYSSSAFAPTQAGVYTFTARYSGDGLNGPAASSCGASNESVTVSPAVPSLATQALPTVAFGGQVSDSAVLSAGVNPAGSITFSAFGPADSSCSGPVVFTATVSVVGNGTYSSGPFTPTRVGQYIWIAIFTDTDGNNTGAATACGDPHETSVVTPGKPSLSTSATASAPIGSSIDDTATIAGLLGAGASGAVTFTAFGPEASPTCAAADLVFTSAPVPVAGNGPVAPAGFAPNRVGRYFWVASFTDTDGNNTNAATACGDAGETTSVTPGKPIITTSATASVQLGLPVSDKANITGLLGPSTSGSITFTAFGPEASPTCAAADLVFTSAPVAVAGNGPVAPAGFTPASVGRYFWIASFADTDGNNTNAATACGDPGETTTVSYRICLLYDPTKPHHGGSAVAIKLEVCDANGTDLSSASITVHATTITPGAITPSSNANPGNNFTFDPTLGSAGGYIYVLKSSGLPPGTYQLHFTVSGDPTDHTVAFVIS